MRCNSEGIMYVFFYYFFSVLFFGLNVVRMNYEILDRCENWIELLLLKKN